ncbi:hypothetical protein FH972_018681 [Carpinus fangiana]|uniref:Uncharacterized protein n=1 Tax=Carpinus fangiana TaxID=176857 RepID=A0A5N6RRQ4_9ROSI|nr:hypothetical protein FH972_018681 [Carpinus fangiana]
MSATKGQTTGPKNPTSSTTLQPETTDAYVWVAPPDIVLTQGGASGGAVQGEATRTPNVSGSYVSYLASQLELEKGHVRELTQQNLELSRQVHTGEYLRSAEKGMQHQESSTAAWPVGDTMLGRKEIMGLTVMWGFKTTVTRSLVTSTKGFRKGLSARITSSKAKKHITRMVEDTQIIQDHTRLRHIAPVTGSYVWWGNNT